MTEQEKIEQACKAHQFRSKKETFQAGVAYALSELCPARMTEAMEWISLKGLYQQIDGVWCDKLGGQIRFVAKTTEDLLKLFDKYKHNQDATK